MMVGARGGLGVVALTCALALTACTPDRPAEPTPSPSPASQTPTETAQERQERLDYAAAEKSYRTFRAEYIRVLRAGGAREPTAIMKDTASGEYLDTFTEVTRGFKALGSHAAGKEIISNVKGVGYSETAISLAVCEDDRGLKTVRQTGENASGDLREAQLEVRKVAGRWRVWSGSGKVVQSCN